MKAKTILITGMSGIKIEDSLKKFISNHKHFLKNKDEKPIIIKIDSIIENTYYELNSDVPRSNQVWKDVILKQSYPILQELWKKAFEKVITKVGEERKRNSNQNIFINLHSCYYHNRTQEYLSLINISSLAKVAPDLIITLIDDIYEIHHRLTKPGGIYHDESNVSHTQMILRLLRLLDWRAKETMMSRFIANQLEIKNYVFATKHSLDTFYNLIFEDYKKVYLSHPITEVRRLKENRNFEEAENIMPEITEISERLSSLFTTFLPTTIDEFRINYELTDDGKTKNYLAVLGSRWENQIYENPKEFLYTYSDFKDENDLWKLEEPEKINEQINHLLEALSDFISDQVTIRDYTLVEQSEMLVIYRPLFNGNASGGVREEFNYYKRLIKDTKKDILCYIYCPKKDIEKFYIRQFELKIKKEIKEEGTLESKPDEFKELSPEEREQLLKSVSEKILVLDVFDKVMDNHKLKILVQNEVSSPLRGNKVKEFKDRFAEEFLKSVNSIINGYKEDVTYFEEFEMSVENFVDKIPGFQ